MTTIRAGLVTTKFPYNFSELSNTVILDRGLQTQRRATGNFQGAEADQTQGIPQSYYMANVMPIARGFASVAYSQTVPPIPGNPTIRDMFELRGDGVGLAILAVGFQSQFIYDADTAAWVTVVLGAFAPGTITVANVKGLSYIGVGRVGVYVYNFATKALDLQPILGLDVGEITGWFAAGASLGAFTATRVFWSSNTNTLDFIPSLSTGAGSTSILAVTSEIVSVVPLGEDFIVYTSTNAVAGRQTGNIQYPFVFTEVAGSAGISKDLHIASDSNNGVHIIWTPMGFQQVNVQEASFIWPELRDGITRGIQIKLDPIYKLPYIAYQNNMDVRISYCGNNYIAVSLRKNEGLGDETDTIYDEAYIFDFQLKRWGRLVVPHRMFFEYTIQVIEGRYTYAELEADYLNYNELDNHIPPLAYYQIESNPLPAAGLPGANFGVVGINGQVHVMAPQQTAKFRGDNFGIEAETPRIFLGRYKIEEDQGIVLQGIKLHKLRAAKIRAHSHLLDGTITNTVTHFKPNPYQLGHWVERCSGDSVSIDFAGSFELTDLSLDCTPSGFNNQFGKRVAKWFNRFVQLVSPSLPLKPLLLGRNRIISTAQGYLPHITLVYDFDTNSITKIYQGPKIIDPSYTNPNDASNHREHFVVDNVFGDWAVSCEHNQFAGFGYSRRYATVHTIREGGQVYLEEFWNTEFVRTVGVDCALVDCGEYWSPITAMALGENKFCLPVYCNEPTYVCHFKIVTINSATDLDVDTFTIDLSGISGAQFFNDSKVRSGYDYDTDTLTLSYEYAVDGVELVFGWVSFKASTPSIIIDSGTKSIVIGVGSYQPYSSIYGCEPSGTGPKSENCLDLEDASFHFGTAIMSIANVKITNAFYYGESVEYSTYDSRAINDSGVPDNTLYNNLSEPIAIVMDELIENAFVGIGYSEVQPNFGSAILIKEI